ncbi:MAG TPA: aminotransferase class III-fold pyridoxal phosphate-dependent enzyme [Gemmataceae bacterium]|jgi:acetylornithine/succinyldiaminopimelate/putrescine aminotransferase
MTTNHRFLDTCKQLLQEGRPNFFRLYLNPFVVQTCLCLSKYIEETWYTQASIKPPYQSFLANGFDEALSGAIKLARYAANVQRRPFAGVAIDGENCLGPFSSIRVSDQGKIDFLSELTVLGREDFEAIPSLTDGTCLGYVILILSSAGEAGSISKALQTIQAQGTPLILCVDRDSFSHLRSSTSSIWKTLIPDIVVFDESFVHKDVPFGAFTAKKSLYNYWNTPDNSTFHSTTFQPNSISGLHFMRCLERDDPEFYSAHKDKLTHIRSDSVLCKSLLGELYSPFLSKTIALLGTDTLDVKTEGHYVQVKGRRIFDAVAGVACSVRGHNPVRYVEEIADLTDGGDYHTAAAEQLKQLTGLPGLVPAVSGASAVENALRVGLAAQYPRNYVLALKGGFGGKTLLALTGTAKPSYKKHLGPLYESVLYIDPFCDSALEEIDLAFERYPVGLVQLELIQAVGGVRLIPNRVLRHLESMRRERDCLLFVDEVQTGMYRTGPFIRSEEMGIHPDILTIGKGTSDMMFPFAVTLCSETVEGRLDALRSDLMATLRQRYDYEFGYRTLLNTVHLAEKQGLSQRVRESEALFVKLLSERLSDCRAVRDVRVFGLLIAIELNTGSWLPGGIRKKVPFAYIYNLFTHVRFPLLVGYCQYEPDVLKLTPPLSITPEEIESVCDTIASVLRQPLYKLLPRAVGAKLRAGVRRTMTTR